MIASHSPEPNDVAGGKSSLLRFPLLGDLVGAHDASQECLGSHCPSQRNAPAFVAEIEQPLVVFDRTNVLTQEDAFRTSFQIPAPTVSPEPVGCSGASLSSVNEPASTLTGNRPADNEGSTNGRPLTDSDNDNDPIWDTAA
jgi:hypothetical protein